MNLYLNYGAGYIYKIGDTGEIDHQTFNRALDLFYTGQCKSACEEFVKIADIDRTARIYALKCQELSENLPEDWDGVWELVNK